MKMEYYLITALIVSIFIQLIHFIRSLPLLKLPKINVKLISTGKNGSKEHMLVEFNFEGKYFKESCDITGMGISHSTNPTYVWFSPSIKGACFAFKPTMKYILKNNVKIAKYILGTFVWIYFVLIYFAPGWLYQ